MSKAKALEAVASSPITKKVASQADFVQLGMAIQGKDAGGEQMAASMDVDAFGKLWTCSAWTVAVCGTPINLVAILALGWLAFANPDPADCWVTAESSACSPAGGDDATNFGALFRLWFLIGFIIVVVWAIFSVIYFISVCAKAPLGLTISLVGQVAAIANIVWVVLGFIWLGSAEGQIAIGAGGEEGSTPTFASSGPEHMTVSGGVMSIFLLIELIMMVILYVIFPVCCLISICCCKSGDD